MTSTVFQIVLTISLDALEKKLKNKKQTDKIVNSSNGMLVELKTTIEDVVNDQKQIFGQVKYDYLDEFTTRDGNKAQIKTKSVDFTFLHGSGLFLIIHSSVKESRVLAQQFSRMVFKDKENPVLPCDIRPPAMQKFLNSNKHTVIACSWDALNIPSITGTNVMGGGIEKTKDYKRYDAHGLKKSIRLKLLSDNITLSINRQAGIHFYTKLERSAIEQFIKEKIIPLCR